MTYLSAQPKLTTSWEEICYPVNPVWLGELLPEYEIMATDKQQLIVGQPFRGSKTIFGIQSADYTIIPNTLIREVVDKLFSEYKLEIVYTSTGEFSIHIVLPGQLSIGGEQLQRSMILTNSYNGKTPFSVQGKTLTTLVDGSASPTTSLYREICQNGLIGWADSFSELPTYRSWLKQRGQGKEKKQIANRGGASQKNTGSRKIHHSKQTPELFQKQLYELLAGQNFHSPALTTTVYESFQQKSLGRA
ncbi:MAG TPA: hypothetical protein VGN64_02990, partial [Dyadobacter sp.]|nr:hypothetical protein [Dyadobacter sp.]